MWFRSFLVKVFDFLYDKNKEISKKLEDLGVNQGLFASESYFKTILQNNIFGVDLNEESVEITKLSLWLKTAIKGKKLANLDSNIKCGNSLIDDVEIAGDKAFNWEQEFPEIFQDGGFDVIVGNPPYVSVKEIDNKQKEFFIKKYDIAKGQFDLYALFIEKSFNLLISDGYFGMITSNTFFANKDFDLLRLLLLEKTIILSLVNLGETVFEDANLDVSIIIFKKTKNIKNEIDIYRNKNDFDNNIVNKINQLLFLNEKLNYDFKINCSVSDYKIFKKLNKSSISLQNILDLPRGIEIGGNSDKIIDIKKEGYDKIIFGKNISKYNIFFSEKYIKYENNKSVFKDLNIYKQDKLFIQRIRNLSLRDRIIATYDNEGYLATNTLRIGILNNKNFSLKYLLVLLNSKLINYLFLKLFLNKDIYTYQLQQIPIKNISLSEQKPFIEKADCMLELNKNLQEKINKFLKRLNSNFEIEKLSTKLKNFFELEFSEFVKELKKKKVVLSLKKEDEWEEYFEEYKKEIVELKAKIDDCDKEIDEMVFELYGLDEEERKVVLGN